MILVKRRTLIIMTSFFVLSVLAVSFGGWYLAMQSGSMDAARVKFLAEQLFFAGLVLALALGAYGIVLTVSSLRFIRALDRLVRMSRSDSFSPDSSLRTLGPVGERLADILYEMNRLGEKKSLKIAALHSLADRLVGDLDKRIVVCSAAGTVLYASRGLLTETGLEKKACVGKNADALFPGNGLEASIEAVFGRQFSADGTDGSVGGAGDGKGAAGGGADGRADSERVSEKRRVTVQGVENHKGEPVYALCEFHQGVRIEAVMDALRSSQGFVQSAGKRIAEGVSGFVTGLRKKKE